MKTFAVLSLLSACSIPSALAAELAGAHLPAAIDPLHLFAAFVVVLSGQIAMSDYARQNRRTLVDRSTPLRPPTAKAAHPLAA